MIHTQLELGLKPTAITTGVESCSFLAVSRTPSKRLDSSDDASRSWPTSGGRWLSCRRGPCARAQACTVTPHVARRLRQGTVLWDHVSRYLKAGYSPEQIAGTLARRHVLELGKRLVLETGTVLCRAIRSRSSPESPAEDLKADDRGGLTVDRRSAQLCPYFPHRRCDRFSHSGDDFPRNKDGDSGLLDMLCH